MPKRFLVVALLAALVALPAAIPAAASASKHPVNTANVAHGAKRSHDWTRPKPTIKRAAGQANPTSQSAIRFTVSFSEAVHGFSAAGVRLSGTARATTIKVAGLRNRKSFRVTVAGVTKPGVIVASVKANAARDAAGNLSTAGNSIKVLAVTSKSRQTKKSAPSTPTSTTPSSSSPVTSPPASSPSSSGLIVGTIVNAAGGGTGALDQAVSVGVHWIREDLSWPAIEPSKGRQDWSAYDNLFLTAAQRGIHILPIIDEIPTWSSGATTTWTIPADPTAYATFVGQVAARYGPDGSFWQTHSSYEAYAPVYFEIWNEPWYSTFSDRIDPGRYARLFKAAAIAGRGTNPAAHFIIAADWQYQASDGSWRNWVDDMYTAVPDLNSYFDAYSTHPYGNGSVDNWTPGNGDAFETRRLEVVHNTFVAHGAGDKKMWATEIGWSTCSGGDNCYSEAEQKQNLTRFDALARSSWSSFMAATFYYRLTDLSGSDRTNREIWYGLIRADGSFKPAYDALRAIAAISS